jgi:hypothetical protein
MRGDAVIISKSQVPASCRSACPVARGRWPFTFLFDQQQIGMVSVQPSYEVRRTVGRTIADDDDLKTVGAQCLLKQAVQEPL